MQVAIRFIFPMVFRIKNLKWHARDDNRGGGTDSFSPGEQYVTSCHRLGEMTGYFLGFCFKSCYGQFIRSTLSHLLFILSPKIWTHDFLTSLCWSSTYYYYHAVAQDPILTTHNVQYSHTELSRLVCISNCLHYKIQTLIHYIFEIFFFTAPSLQSIMVKIKISRGREGQKIWVKKRDKICVVLRKC